MEAWDETRSGIYSTELTRGTVTWLGGSLINHNEMMTGRERKPRLQSQGFSHDSIQVRKLHEVVVRQLGAVSYLHDLLAQLFLCPGKQCKEVQHATEGICCRIGRCQCHRSKSTLTLLGWVYSVAAMITYET